MLPVDRNSMKTRARLKLLILGFATIACSGGVIHQANAEYSHSSRRMLAYDGKGLADLAKEQLGVDYKYGGRNPNEGFDCSGLTGYIYQQAGYSLPRGASAQYSKLRPVKQPEPGDLVFFRISGSKISHVGIYTGDFQFIHAPSSGKKVSYADLRADYWKKRYAGSRTVFN